MKKGLAWAVAVAVAVPLLAGLVLARGDERERQAAFVTAAVARVDLTSEVTASGSLRPLLEGRAETRPVAYSEWHVHPSRCGVALKLRTVRTKTHKCTFELDSGAGELYDLVNDPEEMVNRFDDPAYASVRRELHEMMLARPGEIRDPLPEPIGMA